MRILILCTGNSCRSQMAEGFLKTLDDRFEVVSAGTEPSGTIHPLATKVMKEAGIDISDGYPKNVSEFLEEKFDYVITVCDSAKESCPVFTGQVKHRIHIGFDDPAEVKGSEKYILSEFRRVRDEIKKEFVKFFTKVI